METSLYIFKAVLYVSVIFSVLFVSARVYAAYFRNNDECSDDCPCKEASTSDVIVDKTPTEARKIVKKRVSAIKNDKLVITPVEEKPKRGRKKKS